jgi:SAM-dependent methyltransferase
VFNALAGLPVAETGLVRRVSLTAKGYAANGPTGGGDFPHAMDYHQQFFEECRTHAGDLSGLSVLIPGCGTGIDCIPFAESGAHVTGLDFCEKLGDAYSHPNVQYYRGSIEGCEFPSNHFDVVFSIATMEHVQNMEVAFREMVKLARRGGLIYCVAAPLWNSRRGHHVDCLNPFPWVHLRLEREQIAELARKHGLAFNGRDFGPPYSGIRVWEDVLQFLFDSDYFNRAPARRYLAASRDLPVSKPIRNDLWMDGEEELTPAIMKQLEAKGFTREELLATSHAFIARK